MSNSSPYTRARAVVAFAGLLVSSSGVVAGRAAAEENPYNVHIEVGGLVNLEKPVDPKDASVLVKDGGAQVRLAFEYAFSEWVGLDFAWAPTIFFREFGGGTDSTQRFELGVRVRPWWNREGGYLAAHNPEVKWKAADFFSDAWIDAHFAVDAGGVPRIGYDIGAGTRLPVVWPLQLGLFVRFANVYAVDGTWDSPTFKQLVVGLSMDLGFGTFHPEPDADHDGVPDARDRCPDTRRGVDVSPLGCEVVKSSAPPPRCSDTDLDGVCDGSDACPDTRLGTKVDAKGCPLEAAKPSEEAGDR